MTPVPTKASVTSPDVPPFGSTARWEQFHPDAKHRWWNDAMTKMLNLSEEQLTKFDIAEFNLICAFGLPGAGALDIHRYLRTLDYWAAKVAVETHRLTPRYNKNPE